MSGAATTPDQGAPIPEFKQVMGHPKPLWMLFMTEFWERFAFYGIRWALVLYIVAQFHGGNASGEESASKLYGAYLALVYAAAIFGGYVADKVLGYQRSILLGAVIMAAGLFMISMPERPAHPRLYASAVPSGDHVGPNPSGTKRLTFLASCPEISAQSSIPSRAAQPLGYRSGGRQGTPASNISDTCFAASRSKRPHSIGPDQRVVPASS